MLKSSTVCFLIVHYYCYYCYYFVFSADVWNVSFGMQLVRVI